MAPPAAGIGDAATLSFLRKALRDMAKGDRQGYVAVLDELREISNQHVSLLSWLRAFAEVAALLDRSYHEAVEFWLAIAWADQDDEFASSYQHFLESLISAQAFYGQAVAKMVVKTFASTTQQWGTNSDRRLHFLLRRVFDLVPTAPTFVATLLAEHFPHPRAPLNSHIHYLRHAIKVLDYAPKFEQQLLGLVIDRILQIDVHVQKEDIEAVAPIDSQSMVFQMDANPNEESGDPIAVASLADGSLSAIREPPDSDDELDSDTDGTATFAVDQNEMIIKLDSLMVVAFDYLSATFRKLERGPDSNQRLAPDKAAILRARELQSILLDIFDRTIIRSVRSRHVQFLLFYTCSFSDQFADDFLSLLVHKSMDPALPALHRMSAASYVGSFIARAKYIPIDRICESLGVLADWASSYVRKFESPTVVPDHRKYGVFYAVVQAVLYIFVFRWKEVTAAQEDSAGNLRWPRELQSIPSILNSRFRPLKVVARGVAQEFAAVVHRLELHYVNAMIDRRDTKAGTSSSHWPDAAMLDSTGSAPIDSDISYWAILNGFFPFDPYQLPKSSSYIEGLYLEWQDAEDDVEDGRREPSSGGIGIGIGLRTEDADSSEDDDLDKLLSISMSVSY